MENRHTKWYERPVWGGFAIFILGVIVFVYGEIKGCYGSQDRDASVTLDDLGPSDLQRDTVNEDYSGNVIPRDSNRLPDRGRQQSDRRESTESARGTTRETNESRPRGATAPVANDDFAVVRAGSDYVDIDVLANDEGSGLDYESFSLSDRTGMVSSLNKRVIRYQPNTNFYGNDIIASYMIEDDNGYESNAAIVVVCVQKYEQSDIIHPPEPQDDRLTIMANEQVKINVIANDYDPQCDDLDIASIGFPSDGRILSFSKEKGYIIYQAPEQEGVYNLTYDVSDGRSSRSASLVFDVRE